MRRAGIHLFLVLPVMFLLGGCQVAGWLVNVFAPPQKVKAKYVPPKDKTMLVLVDGPLYLVYYEPLKYELTKELNRRIVEKHIARKTVPYESLQRLSATTSDYYELGIPQVGERVGADLVLYVLIGEFILKDEGETSPIWTPRLTASVKVVDVKKGLLWPADNPYGYSVEAVELPTTEDSSERYGEVASRQLAQQMAAKIARLFHDYEVGSPLFSDE